MVDHPHSLMWIPCSAGDPLPRGAVHVGTDKEGVGLYAGRALHEGDLLPAKINPTHEVAYVCWGGEEHAKQDYEVSVFSPFLSDGLCSKTIRTEVKSHRIKGPDFYAIKKLKKYGFVVKKNLKICTSLK